MHDLIEGAVITIFESPIAQAAGMATILGVMRVVYDDKETTWTRIWLEGAMCGTLTAMAGLSSRGLGLSEAWSFVFGGVIAYVGVAVFRKTMLEIVKVRWGKESKDE